MRRPLFSGLTGGSRAVISFSPFAFGTGWPYASARVLTAAAIFMRGALLKHCCARLCLTRHSIRAYAASQSRDKCFSTFASDWRDKFWTRSFANNAPVPGEADVLRLCLLQLGASLYVILTATIFVRCSRA
jgi:hypothetical protein